MELLEEKVGSGVFLEALTGVNMEISRKRVERKRQRAVEKATDPVAAAERRRERTEAGKVTETKNLYFGFCLCFDCCCEKASLIRYRLPMYVGAKWRH